ncbi:MAG: tRNA dihydrouridine(20/20a) synthase DusA [Coxiella sp. RIFCSPHIGHO2_12_FULL_42_15]|nr:MAG: tRNA dihydrouridine(20/20a) synthase DusA [Coxiella sp. RIFCSPHIGHO2_12_FULL_42_15]
MKSPALQRQLSIAPMMGCTDRHFRYLLRLISRQVLLYTEMVTTSAVIHGDRHHLLGFHPAEHPIALQLGGCDPKALADSALIAQDFGYDEVNLNVGCPSDRVQAGQFGACLMKQPALVAECVNAMQQAVKIPVTVKCRIGVDDQDTYSALVNFILSVADAGCQTFIVHARKAWLNGLSPRENRTIPPLHYEVVYALKKDFPQMEFIINGGISSLMEVKQHLMQVDGVMMGRAAYANPWLFAEADQLFFGAEATSPSIKAVVLAYLPYVAMQLGAGVKLRAMTRHLVGLFQGCAGARLWRRYLSEHGGLDGRGTEVIQQALHFVYGDPRP